MTATAEATQVTTSKSSYPTSLQQQAIEKVKALYRGKKAYVILAEIYDEDESPVQYQVHYNTAQPLALDYRIFKVKQGEDYKQALDYAKTTMADLLKDIMFNMGDAEVVVRYIGVLSDGDIG